MWSNELGQIAAVARARHPIGQVPHKCIAAPNYLERIRCTANMAFMSNIRYRRNGKHGAVVEASLAILRSRFASDEKAEGYRKDGPVSVAKFELGEGDEPEQREARTLRQRQACDVIEQLFARIG